MYDPRMVQIHLDLFLLNADTKLECHGSPNIPESIQCNLTWTVCYDRLSPQSMYLELRY